MQLSISNIIWKKGRENFEDFLQALLENDIYAVELSLNSIFTEPLYITKEEISWLKNLLKSYKINVSALHSLTYTRPDLEVFNTKSKREELYHYLLHYIHLAQELETKNIVYGSPKSRNIYKHNHAELDKIFIDFLYKLDANSQNIHINIEPLPKIYCEYLNTFMDGVHLLKNGTFKNIFIQLDTRSIIENRENIDEIFKYQHYIKHVHIGEPNLTMSGKLYEEIHNDINRYLNYINYNNYVSIEVINHNNLAFNKYMKKIIKNARSYYR